ncbi:MAG: hypothetical protein D6763_08985 [Alphaproteobacteria bacterium]|nr:MAG: hypothetical protein D6763_08985 [Alphaproteobacteria bacterium]
MNRFYLCAFRSRMVDGQTEYYPAILDVAPSVVQWRAVDLRTDLADPDAALVMADTNAPQHAALLADPSVEYLFDA